MFFSLAHIARRSFLSVSLAILLAAFPHAGAFSQTDPLPSWNDGAAKKSITESVSRVTAQASVDFVPVEQRIATFDNDGTLWCEQPVYFQLAFALDRVKAMAPQHPEWKKQDLKRVFAFEP